MAEILNSCVKCKCSLASPDKSSKLLPCLHTMCEDCISGRTDVADKIKRRKEEKEQKQLEIAEDAKEQKSEDADKIKEDTEKAKEPPTNEHEVPETEQIDDVPVNTSATDNVQSTSVDNNENTETKDAAKQAKSPEQPGEDKKDDEKSPDIETTSEEQTEKPSENSSTPNEECAERSVSEDKENTADDTDPNVANEQKTISAEEVTAEGDKTDTENSVSESQPSEENPPENQHNRDEESMEETVAEEEEPPPSPVPLTECPVCREPFTVEALIDNVFIRKQAASSEEGEGTEQKCTGCESNPATSFCLQCDDWLCGDCVTAHKRVRMTKDHQLTSIEEALANKGSSSGPVEVSMMCRVHPKEKLTLFCERCEVLTCRDCQLLQHQEHKYQFLQEAADMYKAKLTGSLSLMKDRREVLRRYQSEIEERLGKVKREKSELQQDILRQAEVIVKAVRAAVWSVLSSLHSFTDAAAKRLSREVGDVRDLVGKFDHCIAFMDGILEDGFGLPLLYSKTIVETKCRKVYHTHMEPQSLKGQLNIQYRHDVPSIIRSLPHIGAIYVNGSKYPPEKNSPQPSHSSSHSTSSSSSSSSSSQSSGGGGGSMYRGGGAPANVVVGGGGGGGGVAPPPLSQGSLPHHLPPQDRLYMQMMMSRQSHTNTATSQGPTLSLPGSRRMAGGGGGAGSMGPGVPGRGWGSGGQQLGLPGNQGSGGLMGSMLGQGQSAAAQHPMMVAGRGPTFTPMRLHHRPVEPGHMSSAPTMILGAPHRAQQHSFSSLPAPPPLRSPMGQPQYRGAAEGLHMNSGGQAAMSGVRRGSSMMDANPDPARPASGGHNTPERPLSGEGAAGSMRVKAEPQDSTDCVITSATFKTKRSSSAVAGCTLGAWPQSYVDQNSITSMQELQKNLDEVIRGVPLDLGDNLEQINGGESLGNGSAGVRTSVGPPLSLTTTATPAPAGSIATSASSSSRTDKTSVSPVPMPASTTSSSSPNPTTVVSSAEARVGGESAASLGGTDSGEPNGHQVKGYATGNSMPGFTLAAVESADPNDDYCASCHQGGDVLCCDRCPRVFHLQCHVPVLATVPSGTFVCTLCEEGLMTEGMVEDGLPSDLSGKRKAATGELSDKDLKVCERVLLELYCHPSSIPFHEPVSRAVPNYYKIITNPMDFSCIKNKLASGHFDHYTSVESFLDDCRLVFRNCAVYNSETSEVGKAGKIVRGFFDRLVDRHMPEFGSYARRRHESPEGDRHETERKKRRLTPPPPHSGQQGENSAVQQVH
ncbi:LOW QUALITY PROTEIN: transcription intermediary factor 1-alpha-like [Babylonia areolata]|uniref:LOW QUALITY PROTEIN: transcription intermediary factor 1-alpha-like n=1 Tax=Babylonia areolata TaxID=304850 RepID=UPI003FD4BD9D